MRGEFYQQLTNDLETARAEGLFKEERIITSAQQADITVADGSHVINFCANNYLGLANHPDLIAAAKAGMDSHGFGMASVRFICGTQDSHKELEQKLAAFLGMEDAILYSSCFDANGTTRLLLMVCVCVKLNATAMPTTICRSLKLV